MNIEQCSLLSHTFENEGFYDCKRMILEARLKRRPLKSVTHSFPSFPRRGWRDSASPIGRSIKRSRAGVVMKVA